MQLYSYIILTILAVAFIGFGWYLICLIKSLKTNRKNARKEKKRKAFPLACAGSFTRECGEFGMSASTDTNHFYAPDGSSLNPSAFCQFIVSGNSMSLCGIYDKNLLFVAKDFDHSMLIDLPKILVVKRRDAQPNEVKYKIRRAWRTCTITDDLSAITNEIIESNAFKRILESDRCPSIEVLLDDFFKVRFERYLKNYPDATLNESEYHNVIISTTWHTDDEKGIRFSIHPVKDIIGIVKYSFNIPQNLIE